MNKIFLPLKNINFPYLTSLLLTLPIAFIIGITVSAESSTTPNDQEAVEDLEDEIKKYEKKLNELQGRESSLSKEIEYMDSQISLTQLRISNSIKKIAATNKEIGKLTEDIGDIKVRIEKIITSIDYQKKILAARLRERYKNNETTPLIVIFGAADFSDLIRKSEYLEVLELQDTKMLSQMNESKDAYQKQKTIFEDKKEENEDLKKRLEAEKYTLDQQRVTLENQKQEKRRLLEVTQNDEAKYQKLLAEATKELNQITGAVSVLKNQDAKKVTKGEIIGYQGNTGYSMGEHLHFGVYKYSSFDDIDGWNWYYSNYVDPSKKLKSKSVYWDTGCENASTRTVGKGDWNWPLSNPTVSQGYGHTCWSNIYYGGKDHPAYDMYSTSGAPVFAVDDGDAFFCRNCLGDGGNGVFIFHDDDYMTLYWHLR